MENKINYINDEEDVKEFGEISKYDEALKLYDTNLSDDSVKAAVQ